MSVEKTVLACLGGVSFLALAATMTPASAAVVTVAGAGGAQGAPSQPGENGAPATADAGFSTPNDDAINSAFARGGDGGEGGDNLGALPPGRGGDGGNALALAGAGGGTVAGDEAKAQAIGGAGGAPGSQPSPQQILPFGDGGDGGDAEARGFLAPPADGPGQEIDLEAFGGDGASAGGAGNRSGDGGDATAGAVLSGAQQVGDRTIGVRMDAVGGDGGFGDGRGGDGGDATLVDSVATTLENSTIIFADAAGGDGGASRSGIGGAGGAAMSDQSLTLNNADTVDVRTTASGGNGGDTEIGTLDGFLSGDGGDGFARSIAVNNATDANPNSAARATAAASGGDAGRAFTPGEIGGAGSATAIAEAASASAQTISASADARAGSTGATVVDGAFVQARGGTATAAAEATTTARPTSVFASADAGASGGALAQARSRTVGTAFAGRANAETLNEGIADIVRVNTAFSSEGLLSGDRNDNFADITGAAQAGAGAPQSNGADFFAGATSLADGTTFGAAGSVARELAADAGTDGLGELSFFASVDEGLTLPVDYEAEYLLRFDDALLDVADGDVLRLAFGDVFVSGNGFDFLGIDIEYNSTTLLDVAFTSVTEFFDFFEDGLFQAELSDTGVFGAADLRISIDYTGSNSAAAPSGVSALTSSLVNAVAGPAFGFGLFVGGSDSFFVASGGTVDPPAEVPLPAAVWMFLAGLAGVRLIGKRKSAVSRSSS